MPAGNDTLYLIQGNENEVEDSQRWNKTSPMTNGIFECPARLSLLDVIGYSTKTISSLFISV